MAFARSLRRGPSIPVLLAPDACAKGARPGAPMKGLCYHPNQEGMTAITDTLDRRLY